MLRMTRLVCTVLLSSEVMPRTKKPAQQEPQPQKREMTDEHKASLAEGREQGRAVRSYLEALEAHRPKRRRKRTQASIERRLARIEEELVDADALRRLHLIQERMDLERELAAMGEGVDLSELEEGFVTAARAYGERKGITYGAWREAGVDASVLKRAGIRRGGGEAA